MSVGVDFDFTRWLAARRGAMEQSARAGAAYAFSGERTFRRTLQLARPVTIALEATTRLWRDVARTELLSVAQKVNDQQYPRVYRAAKAAAAALSIPIPVVFAAPTPTIKVQILGTEDAPHLIVNLELAETLQDHELVAAIAHELAHIQNGHILYVTALHYLKHSTAFFVRWAVQPAILTLQAWSRRAEVTCDRAALLAVRDLDKALAALVRLELGVDDQAANEYVRAAPDVPRQGLPGGVGKGIGRFAELFRSHPNVPKRIHALRLFAGSALYAQLSGQESTGRPTMSDVDKQVADLISVL